MHHLSFCRVMLWLLLAVVLGPIAAMTVAERPNIVLIITDDISWDDLGCYGHPVIKTPHIDALAANGVRFTQAYLTTSSCSPSRCSLITGRYPHNTGAPELHTRLPSGQVLFPKLLKEAGYYTAISGKHHMGRYANEGFDSVSGGKGPGRQQDWVALLRERPKDRPFFFWFAAVDAHRNWQFDEHAPRYEPDEVVVPPFLIDDQATREDLTGYYHEVSRTDTYVGKVVAELKKQGVFENTLILYMSDNGRPLPRCKTRLYDSGIKTPLVVSWPAGAKIGVSQSLVSSIDIAATLLDVAGVKQDKRIQGVSFAPVLKDAAAVTREVAFAEHNWHVYKNHERMVRFGDYLYIRNNFPNQANLCKEAYLGGAGESLLAAWRAGTLKPQQTMVFRSPCPAEELFHVPTDPHQFTNLAGAASHKQALEQARDLLAKWTLATGDDVPENPTPDRDPRPNLDGTRGPRPEGKFRHRDFPGAAQNASEVNNPGPVRLAN